MATIVAWAGPASLALLLLAFMGAGGGFQGMATLYVGPALVLPLHIGCLVFLVLQGLWRKWIGIPVGRAVSFGLVYYLVILGIALLSFRETEALIGLLLQCYPRLLGVTGIICLAGLMISILARLNQALRKSRGLEPLAWTRWAEDGIALMTAGLLSLLMIQAAAHMSLASQNVSALIIVEDSSGQPLPGVKLDLLNNVYGDPGITQRTNQDGMVKPYWREMASILLTKQGYRDCRIEIDRSLTEVSWQMQDGHWSLIHHLNTPIDPKGKTWVIKVYLPKAGEGDDLPYHFILTPWKLGAYRVLFTPRDLHVASDMEPPPAAKVDPVLSVRFDQYFRRESGMQLRMINRKSAVEALIHGRDDIQSLRDEVILAESFALIDDERIEASAADYLAAVQTARTSQDGSNVSFLRADILDMERYLERHPDAPIRPYLVLRLIYKYRLLQYRHLESAQHPGSQGLERESDSDRAHYDRWVHEASASPDSLIRFFGSEITKEPLSNFWRDSDA